MTTRAPFGCFGVAIRLLGVSVICAVLFLLDRIIPSLFEFEYSRVQNVTLYLWLLVLPLAGYVWVLRHSRWLASFDSGKRWMMSVGLALMLVFVAGFATLAIVWSLG